MNSRCLRGFTLVELLATLAVASILVAAAIPPMARLMGRSSIRTTESTLFTALHLARTQAIMHGTTVLVCASRDSRHCGGTADWEHGWIAAIDANRDGQPDGAILRQARLDDHTVRLLGTANRPAVRFQPNGSAAGTNITLLVCPRRAHHAAARSVVVSNGGRIREAAVNPVQLARCAE